MVKTRSDFDTEIDYKKYTRTVDFLATYRLTGKSVEQIVHDMCFPIEWTHYVKRALPILEKENNMTGFDMHHLVDTFVMQEEDGQLLEES